MGTNKGNIPDEGVMGAVNNNNRLLAKTRRPKSDKISHLFCLQKQRNKLLTLAPSDQNEIFCPDFLQMNQVIVLILPLPALSVILLADLHQIEARRANCKNGRQDFWGRG